MGAVEAGGAEAGGVGVVALAAAAGSRPPGLYRSPPPLLLPGVGGGVGLDLFGWGLLTKVRLSWMFWMYVAANVKRGCLSVEPEIGAVVVDC